MYAWVIVNYVYFFIVLNIQIRRTKDTTSMVFGECYNKKKYSSKLMFYFGRRSSAHILKLCARDFLCALSKYEAMLFES